MGLFDYLYCEHPLPGVDQPESMEFQTKSFDNPQMEKYKLTADGRLLWQEFTMEDRSDPNAEPGSVESFMRCMTRVPIGWIEDPFHGCLEFHNGRYRFEALLDRGKLLKIDAIDDQGNVL